MGMSELMLPEFDALSDERRQQIMELIAQHTGGRLLRIERFERWGRSCTTGVFEAHGREMVLVPGAEVTLGWDHFEQGLDEDTTEELNCVMDEYEIDCSIPELLAQGMTAVRSFTAPPLLVARRYDPLGWEEVDVNDKRILPKWRSSLRQLEKDHDRRSIEIHKTVRFEKKGDQIRAFLAHEVTLKELKELLSRQGFTMATADEWAWLCGGGCRTLFACGDYFTSDMCIKYFKEDGDDRPYTLEEPNFFGLSIGYDPYHYELVDAEERTVCGGDGGCNICGGLGPYMGYLPASPHARPQVKGGQQLNINFDFCRPVIRLDDLKL